MVNVPQKESCELGLDVEILSESQLENFHIDPSKVEMVDLMYTMFIKYSQKAMMNERLFRPIRDKRNRNIFDKFTLQGMMELHN